MLQFEEMQNFVRVVESGSISRAAEQQGIAKSGVSRRVAAPLSFGLGHLSPASDEFMQAQSPLRVHIDFSDHHVGLVEQGADLAVRIADLDSRSRAPAAGLLAASTQCLGRLPANPLPVTPRAPERRV